MLRLARLGLAVIVVGVAACGSPKASPSTAPGTPAPASSAISVPASLQGTWTADVEGTTASSGVWTLTITAANLSLTNPVGGDPFTLDPTSISETAMTVPADSECPDQSVATAGQYTISLSGDKLTFKVVSDSCGDRSGVLAAAAWVRKP